MVLFHGPSVPIDYTARLSQPCVLLQDPEPGGALFKSGLSSVAVFGMNFYFVFYSNSCKLATLLLLFARFLAFFLMNGMKSTTFEL